MAEARQARDKQPLQALLLASAAVQSTLRRLPEGFTLPSARQTLRDTLASVGGRVLIGHERQVNCVAASPDGRWVVTGSADKTARLWDLRATDPAAQSVVLKGHDGEVSDVAFSPDSRGSSPAATTKPHDCGICGRLIPLPGLSFSTVIKVL